MTSPARGGLSPTLMDCLPFPVFTPRCAPTAPRVGLLHPLRAFFCLTPLPPTPQARPRSPLTHHGTSRPASLPPPRPDGPPSLSRTDPAPPWTLRAFVLWPSSLSPPAAAHPVPPKHTATVTVTPGTRSSLCLLLSFLLYPLPTTFFLTAAYNQDLDQMYPLWNSLLFYPAKITPSILIINAYSVVIHY